MNELPSRERADKVLTEAEVKEIVEAWRSGRLIDREAIDYEAAGVQFIYESGPMFDPASARAIIAAGLSDRKER
jgi:hypothetical protein